MIDWNMWPSLPVSLALMALCFLMFSLAHYWMTIMVLQRQITLRHLVLHVAVFSLCVAQNRFLTPFFPMACYLVIAFYIFGLLRWLYGYRGSELVLFWLKMTIIHVMVEVVFLLLYMPLHWIGLSEDFLASLRSSTMLSTPQLLFSNSLLTALSECIIGAMFRLVRWLRSREGRTRRRLTYIKVGLRLICQLILCVIGLTIAVNFATGHEPFYFLHATMPFRYMLCTIWGVSLLCVAVLNFQQDLQYIFQEQRNETLERQQAISRSLLVNLRYFRHNMINMLYGFEGMILNGEIGDLQDYYREMTLKCALVNNENIAALEKVRHPAVSALLLHAVNWARELELPLNLYIQDGVLFGRGLRSGELCQVLGVLVDNAIEAASAAAERFVSVEIRRVGSAVEIIVKNTYAGTVRQSDLLSGGHSTKEGHQGQGLNSCYALLQKKRHVLLNFFVSEQYVQAQLLLGG